MKKIMRYAIPAAAMLFAAGGRAQAGTAVMAATVPFPFVVNGHTLPAGKYTVERDDEAPSVLLLRGDGRHHPEIFVAAIHEEIRPNASTHPMLMFERQADHYRLTQVRDDGTTEWKLRR